jgi:hypothetical protein
MKGFLPILLISLILSSCGCILNYTRLNPPEIRNPGPEREITLVSFYDTTLIDFKKKKKRQLYKNAYKEFLSALTATADSTHEYSLTVADTLFFIPGDTSRARASLDEIYEALNPQLLIVLLSFDIDRDYDSEKVEEEDGGSTKYAHYYLENLARLQLYGPDQNIISSDDISTSIHIDTREVISAMLAVGPSIGNFQKEAKINSRDLAGIYFSKFFPTEELITDVYHCEKELKGIEEYMVTHNWKEAENFLLEKYDQIENGKVRKKIAQNLVVVYKAMGNEEQKEYWLKRS